MPEVRVVIVEDEPPARAKLRRFLNEHALEGHASYRIVAEADDVSGGLAAWRNAKPDLVFLDIKLGAESAFDLLTRASPPYPLIVFTTAFHEHALRAFELEALDYLTKPVKRERLQAALQRVAQRLNRPPPPPAELAEVPVIIVSDRGRIVRVPVAEVLYLKAELKYVTLRTAAHTHVLDDSLADLEDRLGERFLRVHRNALVARHAVRALERRVVAGEGDEEGGGEVWAVRIAPVDEWLAVSRRQVVAVREALVAVGR